MADQDQTNQQAGSDAPSFNLQRVYLKDLSLEMPNAPHVFLEQEAPQVEVSINVGGQRLAETVFESTVTVTVTTRVNDKVLYLVEGTQAGIFELANIPAEQMDPLLGIVCPTMLYPYLRANVADAITRTSLPALHLAEVNFQALYEQRLAEMAQQQPDAANGNDSGIILPRAPRASKSAAAMSQARPATLRVAVLGAGSWGTALAAAASRRHPTVLWARDGAQAQAMAARHENTRYLPGVALPHALQVSADLAQALAHLAHDPAHALIILGVPVAGMTPLCTELAARLPALGLQAVPLVWTCKGFEEQTARLPHETVQAALGAMPGLAAGVLSGPSFAREVAQGLPVALTVASGSSAVRDAVTTALHGAAVRIYASTDVVGVEVGGALKNVIAVACGICDGLALGTNARAALITRGLAEMARFGAALGAQQETFAGLTGLGDLVLTATGELSRNRRVGLEIGAGRKLADILASGMTAEGVRCARAARDRARALNIELPITEAVCAVLFEGLSPMTAVSALLAREARPESPTP